MKWLLRGFMAVFLSKTNDLEREHRLDGFNRFTRILKENP
jgi:hypothetical protein